MFGLTIADWQCAYNTIKNNIFYNDTIWLTCKDGDEGPPCQANQTPPLYNDIDYNLYYPTPNLNGVRYCGSDIGYYAPGTTFSFNGEVVDVYGSHYTLANPLFVNPGNGDFHLQAGSPAIDAGTDVGLPFSGSAPNMGAYEYVGVTPPPDTTPPAVPTGVRVL